MSGLNQRVISYLVIAFSIVALLPSGGALAVPAGAITPMAHAPRASSHTGPQLIAAVRSRDTARVRLLLSEGADPNTRQRQPRGEPLLLSAAIAGDAEMTSALLAAGADPNARDGRGTPILVAAASLIDGSRRSASRLAAVEVLLRSGLVDVNATDLAGLGDGRAALHMAAANGSIALAKLLLAHGADPDLRNRVSETPMYFAAEKGHVELAHALLIRGADPNAVTRFTRMNPLMIAAENGRADMVLYLLSRRVLPYGRNAFGETPLTLAKAARNRIPASAPDQRNRIDLAVSAIERQL